MLVRPLRSKEPEALWNLLSIVKEMFRRGDENACYLLYILTKGFYLKQINFFFVYLINFYLFKIVFNLIQY